MINIQRNFFVDNILREAEVVKNLDLSKIPYRDSIATFKNDNLSLICIDIDRIKSSTFFKKDILSVCKLQNKVILVLVSKNESKLSKIENDLESFKFDNLIVINIYKLGIKKVIDKEREKILKTFLSIETQITIAKLIKNITSLISNKDIRLLSLDLDDTCWNGVIGEDGINKIFLDSNQKKSLSKINKLINKTGLLVSFHSKNNEKIGLIGIKKKLFKYSNIIKKSFKYINWEPKIKSVKKITNIVNFSRKNIIFFDDNISEIKQVNKFLLKENCLWIKNSYFLYLYTKSFYISNINKEKNRKRFKDIKSNISRSEAKDTKGILNYIKTSKLNVLCSIKKIDLKRCEEMSNKTNQFNANYKRYNLKQLKLLKNNKETNIVTFSVKDKYSDSGIISYVVIENKKKYHQIIEFTISCRALGRGLEIFFLLLLIKKFSINDLSISYIKTDRNTPFINMAEKISIKKNKSNYWFSKQKIKSNVVKYEKFIETKIN